MRPADTTPELGHVCEHGMLVRELGSGAPIVWLHGLGESGLCFESIAKHERLSGFRHLIPDLPGYGRSPWTTVPLPLSALADHVAAWLAWRGEGRAIVVGHSMGGVLATMLAEQHPRVVAEVVDVDGNASTGDCTYSGVAARDPIEAFVATGFDRLRDQVYRSGVDSAALRSYYASLRFADPTAFHLHSTELVELSAAETLAARLGSVSAPALYVAGSPDGACPRSLELLDGAGVEVVSIAPAGHWPFIDQPDRFASALERLIGSGNRVGVVS